MHGRAAAGPEPGSLQWAQKTDDDTAGLRGAGRLPALEDRAGPSDDSGGAGRASDSPHEGNRTGPDLKVRRPGPVARRARAPRCYRAGPWLEGLGHFASVACGQSPLTRTGDGLQVTARTLGPRPGAYRGRGPASVF